MKACVIAETSAAARALCAGARGMADEVVLIAPGVEALTGVADKAVHIDVPSGNAIDDAYASVNSVVDAEAPGIVLVEPTRSMKVLAGRLAAHMGTATHHRRHRVRRRPGHLHVLRRRGPAQEQG